MKRTRGYWIITEPGKADIEGESWSCLHCGNPYDRTPGKSATDMGRWCPTCDGPVCDAPGCRACRPFQRRLEEHEARMRLRREL